MAPSIADDAMSSSCSPVADAYACDQSACEYTQYPCVLGSFRRASSGAIAPRRLPHPSVRAPSAEEEEEEGDAVDVDDDADDDDDDGASDAADAATRRAGGGVSDDDADAIAPRNGAARDIARRGVPSRVPRSRSCRHRTAGIG